jgi:hypothetical protein
MTVTLVACAARATAPVAPKASRAALAATAVEWAKRDPKARLWPASVTHGQLIITRGYDTDERFAWVIAEGTEVIAVYRCTPGEIGDVVDAATLPVRAAVGNPTQDAAWSILGSTDAPGPPRPPHVFPGPYVERVMRRAWSVNYDPARAEARAGGQ